jgi:hypothetical protein
VRLDRAGGDTGLESCVLADEADSDCLPNDHALEIPTGVGDSGLDGAIDVTDCGRMSILICPSSYENLLFESVIGDKEESEE